MKNAKFLERILDLEELLHAGIRFHNNKQKQDKEGSQMLPDDNKLPGSTWKFAGISQIGIAFTLTYLLINKSTAQQQGSVIFNRVLA